MLSLSSSLTRSSALASTFAPFLQFSARRLYHEEVKEHFKNPKNVGKFDKQDPNVGTAVVGAAACGDVVQMQVRRSSNSISSLL
jgi:NifU-like protein involved in Fe-S cluster formation